ncbi:micronuclear linker histone polyprotein [Bactrocera oleae]|uniref:micronuclear linker histone polyprotein n=1 Tax=Bactrocera oleae TaxID=104688 RepID=UPI00387EBEB5
MKVLILFCLTGVGLLFTTAPAYARTVRKDNNNKNNKPLKEHPVEALVTILKSKVNATNTLETTLEPPHTTKRAIRLGKKQRPNSKFLQKPEDAIVVPQHTENNDELDLVENTTESPMRQLTTAESNNNNKSEAAVDHTGLNAQLRENKQQEVDNEKHAKAEQSSTEVLGPAEGASGVKENTRKQTQKQKQEHSKEQKEALHNKKVLNLNEISTNNSKAEVNGNLKNKKPTNNNANKVNATKKLTNKPKQQPLKARSKQNTTTTTAPKTNRKMNTGGNKNKKPSSKNKTKKSQALGKPSKRRTRRNRFKTPLKRRPNRRRN